MKKIYLLSIIVLVASGMAYGAKAKTKKVDPEEVLQKGREAFFNYNFEEAADLYDEYRTLKTKAKQPLNEDFEIWETELEIASSAFDRVQKIIVVDSISISRDKFYEAYDLSQSAGSIAPYALLNAEGGRNKELAYMNEDGDYLIYSQKNTDGDLRLYEKSLLLDGTWEGKESLEGDFDKNGDYAFPFMSSDGQTLYFANNGEESMGGYDLFVAQKDALTGEYRQPLNLGMPFNSPYNDIMFAIDEESGLGWWATDRNSPEGNVTVYVYLNEDIRRNYPDDMDNLTDYAKLTSYKDTWIDENNQPIRPVKPTINNIRPDSENLKKDFELTVGSSKIYYKFTDFKSKKAAELMKQYLAKSKELENKEKLLAGLRKQYKTDKSLKKIIIENEAEIEVLRQQNKELRKEVIKIEKSTN